MGTRITVGDWPFEAESFSVEEESTPLGGDDTTGSVGRITFQIPLPDPDLKYVNNTGAKAINTFGPDAIIDRPVRLADSRLGFTLGTVLGVSRNDDGATFSVTCSTRMDVLNAYGIQAQPYVGTLSGAFYYYLGLINVTTDIFVDPVIADRPVVFPGWTGELWYHLKQIAIAHDCDISLVSGVILLRPIRQREAVRGRDISRGRDLSPPTLARAVEVYQYNNVPITDQLVYPPGGWTPETEVLNVNAGEDAEYTLELSASLSSFQTPQHEMFVSEHHDWSSVYTVVANDGHPVVPAVWRAQGGSVRITLNEDTQSLTVKLRGAQGLPLTTGGPATNFSLALGSDTTGNRYSTLRIVGTGVRFTKEKKRVRTGVPDIKTGTDVGVTIDNPFISTHEDFCRAGTRAAKRFAGPVPAISGTLLAINKRGDKGDMTLPRYSQVQDALATFIGGTPTYGQVETYYRVSQGLNTYGDVQVYWYNFVRDDYENQAFGNINGARVWDLQSRRWYRIRSGNTAPDGIRFTAEDDLTHFDVEGFYIADTYGSVAENFLGLTYRQVELAGMFSANPRPIGEWAEISRNGVPNPSAELGIDGWVAARGTLTRDSSRSLYGTSSFRVTITDTSAQSYLIGQPTSRVPVTPSVPVRFSADVWVDTSNPNFSLQFYEYDAAGVLLTPVLAAGLLPVTGGQWNHLSTVFTPKPNAVSVRPVVLGHQTLGMGASYWIDGISIGPDEFFDGDSQAPESTVVNGVPTAFRYRWVGARHASASVLESVALDG